MSFQTPSRPNRSDAQSARAVLVAAGAAGRLQFWDVEKGETFLYLYSFGPEAWLALLPDGTAHGINLL